jgi:hypothetical protein
MVPSRRCVVILLTTHASASGSYTEKRRRKCGLAKPKDCVELAPTKVIVRYTKRPAHTITIWSICIVMPAVHAKTTVGVGPNHQDVTNAGDKASPKSVGVFFVFSLRFPAVGAYAPWDTRPGRGSDCTPIRGGGGGGGVCPGILGRFFLA